MGVDRHFLSDRENEVKEDLFVPHRHHDLLLFPRRQTFQILPDKGPLVRASPNPLPALKSADTFDWTVSVAETPCILVPSTPLLLPTPPSRPDMSETRTMVRSSSL